MGLSAKPGHDHWPEALTLRVSSQAPQNTEKKTIGCLLGSLELRGQVSRRRDWGEEAAAQKHRLVLPSLCPLVRHFASLASSRAKAQQPLLPFNIPGSPDPGRVGWICVLPQAKPKISTSAFTNWLFKKSHLLYHFISQEQDAFHPCTGEKI